MRFTLLLSPVRASLPFVALSFALLASCSAKDAPATSPMGDASADASGDDALSPARKAIPGDSIYEHPGPHPVGHTTFTINDSSRARSLRLEIWYPAAESARAAATAGTALEDLEPPGADHDTLAALVAKAPDCTRKHLSSAADVEPLAGASFPVVAFSHCYDCMRYSAAAIAERLASHGIAVVAPDHTTDTLFDELRGTAAALDAAFLAVRVADIRFTLDSILDVTNVAIPTTLRGRFDSAKVGMMGHSFGSVTVGAVLAADPRPVAGFAIAAPFDLFGGPKIEDVKKPVFFLLAQEDNSISEIGNNLIRNDFKTIASPSWLVEVVDAGHWSFSDICGLYSSFDAGCGTAQRQTDSIYAFNYLENEGARGIAASYAAAYFLGQLTGDAAGLAFAGEAHPDGIATASKR